jgi:anti-anti-sigma factor
MVCRRGVLHNRREPPDAQRTEERRVTMPINIRVDGDAVILSNFGRLMNDPRHFDAGQDVGAMVDQGYRKFVLELRGIGEMGASGLGLLMTITRRVRLHGGDVVLASPSRSMRKMIDTMQMDDYWEIFDGVEEATKALDRETR